MDNKLGKTNFDKDKYLKALASTPLIAIGMGVAALDFNDYIIEEIELNN